MVSLFFAVLFPAFIQHSSAEPELNTAIRELSQFAQNRNLQSLDEYHAIRKREIRGTSSRFSSADSQSGSGRPKLTNEKAIMFFLRMKIFMDGLKMADETDTGPLEEWNQLSSSEQAQLSRIVPAFVHWLTTPKKGLAEYKAAYADIASLPAGPQDSVSGAARVLLFKAKRDLAVMQKWVSEWKKLDRRAKADMQLALGQEFYLELLASAEIAEAVTNSTD